MSTHPTSTHYVNHDRATRGRHAALAMLLCLIAAVLISAAPSSAEPTSEASNEPKQGDFTRDEVPGTVSELPMLLDDITPPKGPPTPGGLSRCIWYPLGYDDAPTQSALDPDVIDFQQGGTALDNDFNTLYEFYATVPPGNEFPTAGTTIDVLSQDTSVYYSGNFWPQNQNHEFSTLYFGMAQPFVGSTPVNHVTFEGAEKRCADTHFVYADPTELNPDNPSIQFSSNDPYLVDLPLGVTSNIIAERWVRSLSYIQQYTGLNFCLNYTDDPGLLPTAAAVLNTPQGFCWVVFRAAWAGELQGYLDAHVDTSSGPTPTPEPTPTPGSGGNNVTISGMSSGYDYDDRHGDGENHGQTWDGNNWRCFGQVATIVGTEDGDLIRGTGGRDVIVGLGGNDVIYGRGHHDIICGGEGVDTLSGGSGEDHIHGGPGGDFLYGDGSDDTIWGGSGGDRIRGGGQNDTIFGGSGGDSIRGDERGDFIYGGSDDDVIEGNAGSDYIEGGPGYDSGEGGTGAVDICQIDVEDATPSGVSTC